MKTLRVYITGTVQGVFFRKYIKDKADELNIRGFVRNLDDGRIEIIIEGRDENVNEMLSKCKQGPSHAEIKEINFEGLRHQGFKGFKISSF